MASLTAPPQTALPLAAPSAAATVRITPPHGWLELRLAEVWQYRELLYFFDEGRGAAGARKPAGEICVVYGRGVVLRGHEGVPVYASLFARIPGDWKHDWTAFAQACRRCRWEGPQRLRIEADTG